MKEMCIRDRLVIFVAVVAGTSFLMNSQSTDNRSDMNDATLPEVMVKIGSTQANKMYGYRQMCIRDRDNIVKEFSAYAVEMEGAAIGQAAALNGIPFLIIRAISDKADNSANMDYPAFEKLAIEHSVRLTQGMLKRMA